MEIINFRAVERSTQDVSVTINRGNSERWDIQSQKTKYVNGKMSGVIGVGYTASIDNTSDYLLEEDKSNNSIQITANADGTSGTCVLTQNESGNKINLHLTTPQENEYWHINFTPLLVNGVPSDNYFYVETNISGEEGVMSDGSRYTNWIVNQNRDTINIYIYPLITLTNSDILSWSCLDKDGNAFSPIFNIPDSDYFETRTTGLGSYTLKVVSTPPASSVGTMVLSGRFNPTNKYPLNLNFYLKS